ncbi:MAG: hypothetical protein JNG88_15915 [Phycisphaerales bacterium]|nr:hypothetical protein [Phycisphaerales bacterium]
MVRFQSRSLRRAGINVGLIVTLVLLVLVGGGLYLAKYLTNQEKVVADSLETLTLYCRECKAESQMSLEEARKVKREESGYVCPKCSKPAGTFEKPGTVVVEGKGG